MYKRVNVGVRVHVTWKSPHNTRLVWRHIVVLQMPVANVFVCEQHMRISTPSHIHHNTSTMAGAGERRKRNIGETLQRPRMTK
jgi:hypothetical protein